MVDTLTLAKLLARTGLPHSLVLAENNYMFDAATTAEDLLICVHGIRTHMGIASKRITSDAEKKDVFLVISTADDLIEFLRHLRRIANPNPVQVKIIIQGLSDIMRAINTVRDIVDSKTLNQCVTLVRNARDALMIYGVPSRQTHASAKQVLSSKNTARMNKLNKLIEGHNGY